MAFAMLTISKLLIGVRLASKILTNRHAEICFLQIDNNLFNKHATGTGVSDFYKRVATVIKIHYKKQKKKNIQYRNYKLFHEQSFDFELNNELLKIDNHNTELKEFQDFLKVLDKHAART